MFRCDPGGAGIRAHGARRRGCRLRPLQVPDRTLHRQRRRQGLARPARNRAVPARLFIPQAAAGQTFPVVVFSHGLWTNRESYGYFARHIASHGYVVILPQHTGSDTGALSCLTCDVGLVTDWLLENPVRGGLIDLPDRNLLQSSIQDPNNLVNRPLDISFAIDQIATDPALTPVANSNRIGVAGHSFGAYTAMAAGGMLVDLPEELGGADRSFRDSRITATLAMSAQGPGTMGISDGAWSAFGTPAMFLTGTFDYSTGGPSAGAGGAPRSTRSAVSTGTC